MKNFKKIIALVLVVAMLASFATMTSATSFTDDAAIENFEAVEVLVALGIVNGNVDGSFNPTGSVTRAEMAKMVTFIMNEGEDVSSHYEDACQFTDCWSHWARGYIAFANTEGIIDGMGDGTFDPDGTVTGAQAAKMLLCALGYDSTEEGLTGTNWYANTTSLSRSVGLQSDMTSNFSFVGELSREDAAQMMLNALTSTMVEYSGGMNVDTTDVSVYAPKDRNYVANNNNFDFDEDEIYTSNDDYYELCEWYFEDLYVTSSNTTDLLGRGAHVWTLDKTDIGTYSDEADYTFIADDDLDVVADEDDFLDMIDDLAADLDLAANVTYILNGDDVDAAYMDILTGDVVEIYDDDDGDIAKVVVIRYSYATIDEIDVEDDIEDCLITMDDDYACEMNYDDSLNFAAIYAVAEEGDALLIVADDDNNIVYAEYPTMVTGDISKVSDSSYIVLDGTTYYMAEYAYTGGEQPEVTEDDEEATLYLNSYGYVVYCDYTSSSTDDYALAIVATYSALDSSSKIVDMATVVFADGTTADVEIDGYEAASGDFCSYVEEDDVYTLTKLAAVGKHDDDLIVVAEANSTNDIFTSTSSKATGYTYDTDNEEFDVDATAKSYFNDPMFIFIDSDDEDVTVYEGVTSYSPDATKELVMYVYDPDGYIIAVFVDGTADSETADEVIYVAGKTDGKVTVNGTVYYTYEAYLDGSDMENEYFDISSAYAGFYEYSIGDDGEYELSRVTANGYYVADEEYVYDSGVSVSSVTNSKYITVDGGAVIADVDFDLSSAKFFDVVDGDYSTLAKLEKGLKTYDSFEIAFIGESEDYTIQYVFVTAYGDS